LRIRLEERAQFSAQLLDLILAPDPACIALRL
jgi:hypothetical protein